MKYWPNSTKCFAAIARRRDARGAKAEKDYVARILDLEETTGKRVRGDVAEQADRFEVKSVGMPVFNKAEMAWMEFGLGGRGALVDPAFFRCGGFRSERHGPGTGVAVAHRPREGRAASGPNPQRERLFGGRTPIWKCRSNWRPRLEIISLAGRPFCKKCSTTSTSSRGSRGDGLTMRGEIECCRRANRNLRAALRRLCTRPVSHGLHLSFDPATNGSVNRRHAPRGRPENPAWYVGRGVWRAIDSGREEH